jgi:hypothetical protein
LLHERFFFYQLTNLFRELVMIPHMIGEEIFSLEVLLEDEEALSVGMGKEVGEPQTCKKVC